MYSIFLGLIVLNLKQKKDARQFFKRYHKYAKKKRQQKNSANKTMLKNRNT